MLETWNREEKGKGEGFRLRTLWMYMYMFALKLNQIGSLIEWDHKVYYRFFCELGWIGLMYPLDEHLLKEIQFILTLGGG